MHGKKNLRKSLRTVNRKNRNPKPIKNSAEIQSKVDIGNWRLIEDEDGSLAMYNFETGNNIVIARK